jgi:hypothetical protein
MFYNWLLPLTQFLGGFGRNLIDISQVWRASRRHMEEKHYLTKLLISLEITPARLFGYLQM